MRHLFVIMTLLSFGIPASALDPSSIQVDTEAFKKYWYSGQAELTKYALSQARYGDMHEGHAVLIFVTEDFLKDHQVKREFGNDPAHSVLKLNTTRKFLTGMYPYSIMTSVFSNIDFKKPDTLKVTFSSQEWCGQVFMQANQKHNQLEVSWNSYFQREGDQDVRLPTHLMEDEIPTMIRIAPNRLPVGKLKAYPSMLEVRLGHKRYEPLEAEADLTKVTDATFSKTSSYRYRIVYPKANRSVSFYFEPSAPFRILGWQEKQTSRPGKRAITLTTTAVRTHEFRTDYWSKNRAGDRVYRKKLGL